MSRVIQNLSRSRFAQSTVSPSVVFQSDASTSRMVCHAVFACSRFPSRSCRNASEYTADRSRGTSENAAFVRKSVCEYLGYLGITVDDEANGKRGDDIVISTADSKVKVCVIPTNEELAIARETVAIVGK